MALIFLLTAHLILLVSTKFTLWPEMVVYPYLMNNGFLLYRDLINPYPPLFLWFLSSFSKIFGYQPFSYQVLTWATVILIDFLIFYVTQKIFKNYFGALSAVLFFAILSIPFLINGLWFDLIQTPFIILATFCMYNFLKNPQKYSQFILSAVFLIIAFFIKQQVIWLALAFCLALLAKFGVGKINLKNLLKGLFIFFILLTAQIIFFWHKGTLNEYLRWVYLFPLKASSLPGYLLLPTNRQLLVLVSTLVFFLPTSLYLKKENRLFLLAGLFLILCAYPRFDYFHLIPSLSILSLVVGENVSAFKKVNVPIKAVTILSSVFLVFFTARYLSQNRTKDVRFFENDIYKASAFVNKSRDKNETIYIQNGPDQILPLSGRLPPKPWADELPWYMEADNTQHKVLAGLIKEDPKYIVYKPYDEGGKFDLGSYRPTLIESYINNKYKNAIQITDTLWLKVKI